MIPHVVPVISVSPIIEEEEEGIPEDIPNPLLIQPPLFDTVSVFVTYNANTNKPKEVAEVL